MARVAAGFFGGVLGALVQTMVGDVIPFERRGQAMGIIMSAFSMSTVAGVPISLWMAGRWGWHVPFVSIATLCLVLWALLWWGLPRMSGHLTGTPVQPWDRLRGVVSDANHWRAFALSSLMVLGSFSIIPYITIYTTTNVGLPADKVPLIYLVGGVATLFTARAWGVLADRWGKVHTFRALALLATLPMVALTHLGQVGLPVLLVVTTAFFVFVSGRMVPGMALLTAAPQPALRGGFMSVNGAIQSGAMGLAAWLGGQFISRGPDGLVQGYERCGWLALATTLLMLWWVGQVRVHVGTDPARETRPA
jgi:predicted MFS family arabinose efflux permease